MLTAREYLKSTNDNSRTCEMHNVEEEAKKRHIDRPADLYYAINMLYSDLSNVLGKDPDKYIAVAKALYWDDPDMPEGKLFRRLSFRHLQGQLPLLLNNKLVVS